MNRKKYYIALVFLAFFGCTNKFNDLVSDPSAVNQASPGSFLNSILIDGVNAGLSRSHTINNELTQVTVSLAEVASARVHRYILPPSEAYLWNNYYLVLTDADNMYQKAEEYNDNNYKAIAMTLKAWLFQNLTDIYGDIPYKQALRGYSDYLLQPRFDTQQAIYQDLIKQLDEANALYDDKKALTLGADILYNADNAANATTIATNITKWKKFTNSLRLRVLMRVEGKYPQAPQLIQEMLADPVKYPLMTNLNDGASLKYTGTTPLINPFSTYRDNDFSGNRGMGEFFINKLNSWEDPRLGIWCSQVGGIYAGVPSGYSEIESEEVRGKPSSRLNIGLKNSSQLGSIMQYAEVEFLLAEAALRGYIADNPEDHYKKGVTASLSYWGATVPTDFFDRSGVKFDGSLEQIMTQKYFSLFFIDMQQWFEIRRTGYPVLPKGNGMENNKELPSRLKYPLSLQSLNLENYNAAVARMGGDEISTKVWWQQ